MTAHSMERFLDSMASTNANTLEACREELEEVLEGWILFQVSKNLPLPLVDGITF
jgi:predicted RNase H-like HicB family nuclease